MSTTSAVLKAVSKLLLTLKGLLHNFLNVSHEGWDAGFCFLGVVNFSLEIVIISRLACLQK